MKIKDLLDLSFREVLENYCIIQSLECDYIYGLAVSDDVETLFNDYNIEDEYPEGFDVETVIGRVVDYDEDVYEYDRLVRIMNNLGISHK